MADVQLEGEIGMSAPIKTSEASQIQSHIEGSQLIEQGSCETSSSCEQQLLRAIGQQQSSPQEEIKGAVRVSDRGAPKKPDLPVTFAEELSVASAEPSAFEPDILRAYEIANESGVTDGPGVEPSMVHQHWVRLGNLLMYRLGLSDREDWRVVVPIRLRQRAIQISHDLKLHGGTRLTKKAVRASFWFPGIDKAVDTYVNQCDVCSRVKLGNPVGARRGAELHPVPPPMGRWQVIAIDLLTGLPRTTSGFDAILAIVCLFSGRCHLWPTVKTLTAPQMARMFYYRFFPLHGVPDDVISDRDSRIISAFMQALSHLVGVKLKPTQSANHQQADRAETLIRKALKLMRAVLVMRQWDWDLTLPLVEFSLNDTPSDSESLSPFEKDLGYSLSLAKVGLPISSNSIRNKTVNALVEELDVIKDTIRDHRADVARESATRFNSNIKEEKFLVGDQVMLTTRFLKAFDNKLLDMWIGPFPVVEVYPHHQYGLQLPEQYRRLHPVIDGSCLKKRGSEPVNLRSIPSLAEPRGDSMLVEPSPKAEEPIVGSGTGKASRDPDEYEVQKILDVHVERGRKRPKFLVRWKGYSPDNDTWEPPGNLIHSSEIVRQFLSELPRDRQDAIRPFIRDPFRPLAWEQDAANISIRSIVGSCRVMVSDLPILSARKTL